MTETLSVPGPGSGRFPRTDADHWVVLGARRPGEAVSAPLHPIRVTWENGEGRQFRITVPRGFPTDLASVPRLFRPSVSPAGRYDLAAIVHDWLYYQNRVGWRDAPDLRMSRGDADAVLDDIMIAIGIGGWTRFKIYRAVRVGGWLAWST
ncbi:MAG: DUF1353 domain-containing protein [Magnetospiraceae bacterium]